MKKQKAKQTPVKLDLSYGPAVQTGFARAKLSTVPSNSVEEIWCSFLFNRIPANKRHAFIDECYRVLKTEGKLTIIVPYWLSMRSIQDFGHAWPPVSEHSFLYFNRAWRESQKLQPADKAVEEWNGDNEAYDCKANFDFTFGYILDPEVQTRSEETRSNWIKHYANAVTDLQVVLTKLGD